MERPFRARWKLSVRAFTLAAFASATAPWSAAQPGGPPPSGPPPPLSPEILAQRPTEPPPDLPNAAELREELTMLYEFLSAPPEKLERMRRKIEMIEQMSPENREFLRMRLVQLQADAPKLQAEIESATGDFTKAERALAVHYWLSLRVDERDTERERMAAMDPAARADYLRDRLKAFRESQAKLRSQLLDARSAPPQFTPPPPPPALKNKIPPARPSER